MKTNAIISALCVVGIIGAFANDGALIQRGRTDGPPAEPRATAEPIVIPVQKVVYWRDIPGMKWNWTTQVTNKPSIPTVGTLNTTATSAQSTSASESLSGNITLHKIAKTGAYSDLSGTPTIPSVGTLNTTLTTAQATSANESLSGTIKLHKVSKTGNLEDLSGTSLTIGNVEAKYVKIKQTGEIEVFDDFGDSVVYKLNLPNKNGHLAVLSDIPSTNGLAAKSYVDSHQWTWASITNKPSFATVATSGSYNDLSNKPSIPTVGTLNTTATTTQTTSASESFSGNITLHKVAKTGAFADMTGNQLTLGNIGSVGLSLDRLGNVKLRDNKYNGDGNLHTITFPINKDGTLALNEDVSAIVPAWVRNSAVSYTAGDLVRYNNKLYKAKQNIAANQAWNANNWEEVTIAAEFRSKADTSWVNNHKWDWGTQVTNSPFALHTTGFPYVEVPIGFAVTDSGYGYAIPSSASFAGAKVHGIESLGVGDGIITNCYGGIGLGMAFNVTNDVAFVWSGRSYDAAIKYGSHGMSTFNVDPHDGPAGFWIGETNLATYLANAGSGEHTHSNLVNGTTQVIANRNGTASISAILPPTYSVSLQNQVDGSTWNWNIVFLGYLQVGGEKIEIDLDDMITTRGNLGSLTDIRVSITQQETGAVVAQEQTITLVPYAENSWQFGNDLVLEPAFSSMQTYFTSMGPPFSIACLETTGGESPYNYTFGSQFGPLSGSTGMFLSGGGPSLKTIATVDQIPSVPTLATVATSGSYNDLLNKPTNVSAFNNDAGYLKTNTIGSLVIGPFNANQSSGAWSAVISGGGANNESEGSIIVGPSSHIYPSSPFSSIFAPGASIKSNSGYSQVFGPSTIDENSPYSSIHGGGGSYIKSSYSHIFGGSALVETNCMSSFVIGNSGHSTNSCTFLWTAHTIGDKMLPAAPVTHGDGTFNINTYDGVAGVYIGDTNLQQIIRMEARAMIHDAVSQVNVNLQSAEDTRVALTNLITILKNL